MNSTRWLLALVVVVAGCNSATETPPTTTTTTTAPPSTTTTVAPAAAINLGGEATDNDYCFGHVVWVADAGEELGIFDIPRLNEGFKVWVAEHPDEFVSACAIANLSSNTDEVIKRIGRLYDGKASAVLGLGLDDTERVWCSDNWADVVRSADVLGVGPADLLPALLGVPPSIVEDSDDTALWMMWVYLAPDVYVRACEAAFGAR